MLDGDNASNEVHSPILTCFLSFFNGKLKPDGGILGKLTVNNIKVLNGPILAQLMSLASLNGLIDMLAGNGIFFEKGRSLYDSLNFGIKKCSISSIKDKRKIK
mgnify:CR=1 FL=1